MPYQNPLRNLSPCRDFRWGGHLMSWALAHAGARQPPCQAWKGFSSLFPACLWSRAKWEACTAPRKKGSAGPRQQPPGSLAAPAFRTDSRGAARPPHPAPRALPVRPPPAPLPPPARSARGSRRRSPSRLPERSRRGLGGCCRQPLGTPFPDRLPRLAAVKRESFQRRRGGRARTAHTPPRGWAGPSWARPASVCCAAPLVLPGATQCRPPEMWGWERFPLLSFFSTRQGWQRAAENALRWSVPASGVQCSPQVNSFKVACVTNCSSHRI